VADLYAELYEGSGLTEAEIWAEIICDSLGDMNVFEGTRTAQDAPVAAVLAEAKAEAKQQAESNRGPPNGQKNTAPREGRMSLALDAEKRIDDVLAGKPFRENIVLTDSSPTIMIGHAGVRNLPLAMKATHIRENILSESEAKALGLRTGDGINYHGLGKDLFLRVINGLNNVKEAYRGTKNADDPTRRENYFLMISQFSDADGNTINVPVYINTKSLYNQMYIDTNTVATVFGKEGIREYIREQIKRGNLVRIKRRGNTTSERPAPVADDYSGIASKVSIPDAAAKSNPQNAEGKTSLAAMPETVSAQGIENEINGAGLNLTSKDNNKNNLRIRRWLAEHYPDLEVAFENDKTTGTVRVTGVSTKEEHAAQMAERDLRRSEEMKIAAARERFRKRYSTPDGYWGLYDSIDSHVEKDGYADRGVTVHRTRSTVGSLSFYVEDAGRGITVKISDHNTVGQEYDHPETRFVDLKECTGIGDVWNRVKAILDETEVQEDGGKTSQTSDSLEGLRQENEELRGKVKEFEKALRQREKQLQATRENRDNWRNRATFRPESVGREIIRAYEGTINCFLRFGVLIYWNSRSSGEESKGGTQIVRRKHTSDA